MKNGLVMYRDLIIIVLAEKPIWHEFQFVNPLNDQGDQIKSNVDQVN